MRETDFNEKDRFPLVESEKIPARLNFAEEDRFTMKKPESGRLSPRERTGCPSGLCTG